MTIRILVVDDEELVRTGIGMILEVEPDLEVCGTAADGAEAVQRVAELVPDVVLMDVRMPVLDGIEATRVLTSGGDPAPAVLMLTTYYVDEAVAAALRAGASGVVLKDAAPVELVTAVRAVADGEAWLDPAVARALVDEFRTRADPAQPTPAELGALTHRELEVLRWVAHGLNNQEIADGLVVSENTVKTHVSRILLKLGLRDRAQAVAAAYRLGVVRPDDPPPIRGR